MGHVYLLPIHRKYYVSQEKFPSQLPCCFSALSLVPFPFSLFIYILSLPLILDFSPSGTNKSWSVLSWYHLLCTCLISMGHADTRSHVWIHGSTAVRGNINVCGLWYHQRSPRCLWFVLPLEALLMVLLLLGPMLMQGADVTMLMPY